LFNDMTLTVFLNKLMYEHTCPNRVLILEDNAADAELMVRELRKAGLDPKWELVDTEQES